MKNQIPNTPQERRMKFAEAGVMFVLILALTVFIGVRVASRGQSGIVTPEPVAATDQAAEVTDTIVAADQAEHPDEAAADSITVTDQTAAEISEPRIVTYAAAEKAYFDRRYDEAADMFGIYAAEHPANAWGFYMLGMSAWKAGDDDAAESAFAAALQIKPDHVKSLVNYGRVLLEQDRPDEAKTRIDLALAADPDDIDARRVLARIQYSEGLLAEAAASYRTVLQTNRDDAWSLNNLGLIRIQQGRYEEALPALARAARLAPDVACFQNNLGVALERTGHTTAAEQAYAAALAADDSYEKAETSRERVSLLTQAPGTAAVDLDLLADSFGVADDMEVAAARPTALIKADDEPAPAPEDGETPTD